MEDQQYAVHQSNNNFGNFLDAYEKKSKEARETIRTMLAINSTQKSETWRGLIAIPPASSIEQVIGAYKRHTDIPLEIPFFCFIHCLSGWLLQKKVQISARELSDLYPDLWTIVLAPSGSGKTKAHSMIAKMAPEASYFPEPNSGARFIQALSEKNFSIWFQDEIAQKLKQIESPQSPLADIKEYLLRAYSYEKIERSTKAETITVEEPCIGILGLNTRESFMKAMSEDSLLDGFAQRFCYVIAEPDPGRSAKDFPIYDEKKIQETVKNAFNKITSNTIHPTYVAGADCIQAFKESFSILFTEKIPTSFYRRILFRSLKYALYYHLILCKPSNRLDAEDIGWAARLSVLHLQDVKNLLNKKEDDTGITKYLDKARKVKAKLEAEGKKLTPRELRNSIYGVKTQEQALTLIALLESK